MNIELSPTLHLWPHFTAETNYNPSKAVEQATNLREVFTVFTVSGKGPTRAPTSTFTKKNHKDLKQQVASKIFDHFLRQRPNFTCVLTVFKQPFR